MSRYLVGALAGFLILTAGSQLKGQVPQFEKVVIDEDIGDVCYGVLLVDIDGDQRQDIVAVTENRVLWYQAPDWTKRVITADQTERDNVCIAASDIDGDGRVDLALGAGWTQVGTISWLKQGADLDQPWRLFEFDRQPWTHRMRFADVLGSGKPQLVVSPLNKSNGNGVRLTAFQIPENPTRDRWLPVLMNQELNRLHNHTHLDWDRDGVVDTLTASESGISLIRQDSDGGWTRTQLTEGGAGEIRVGNLNRDGDRFIATIEPMHGTDVVVYRERDGRWHRQLLDDSLGEGHALVPSDLDGDGTDELIAGHRKPSVSESRGPGLFFYRADDATGVRWSRHTIDLGGIAVEDAAAADLNGDGRIDIVAGGRGTRNLNLYLNRANGHDR